MSARYAAGEIVCYRARAILVRSCASDSSGLRWIEIHVETDDGLVELTAFPAEPDVDLTPRPMPEED